MVVFKSKSLLSRRLRRYASLALAMALIVSTTDARAACTSPAGTAGQMVFNQADATLYYCDDTNWLATSAKPYVPDAVDFGAASANELVSTLTGVSDSKQWTGSLWFKNNVTGTSPEFIDADQGAGGDISVMIWTDNIAVEAYNPSNVQVLRLNGSVGVANTEWHHLMFSVDLTDVNKRHLYIDGKSALFNAPTYVNDVMDFTPLGAEGFSIGGSGGLASNHHDGQMAEFWMDFGTYIDLSVEANRRKFISARGYPVELGADGSAATGTAPDIFLSGPTASWHTNKGTGGGFTENGALVDGSFSLLPDSQPVDLANGLIAHWLLDETSGAAITDAQGTYSGTWTDGANNDVTEETTAGQVGTALAFDGGDEVTVTSAFTIPAQGTIALWLKTNTPTTQQRFLGTEDNFEMKVLASGYLSNELFGNGGTYTTSNTAVSTDWVHVVMTWESVSNMQEIYIDGVLDAAMTRGTGAPVGTTLKLGARNGSIERLNGVLDDVRIYNRVLNQSEVIELYNNGAPPSSGQIRYSSAYSVMEYYDGRGWVAMGPVLGVLPADTDLVGHWKLDETSGTQATDSSGQGNHGNFQNTNFPAAAVDGLVDGAIDFSTDGDSGINSVPLPSQIPTSRQFTFTAWVYPRDFNATSVLIDNSDFIRIATAFNGNNILLSTRMWGTDSTNWGDGLVLNKWQHVAVSYDFSNAANRPQIYIDGVLDDQDDWSGGDPVGPYTAPANSMMIAKRYDSTNSGFHGMVDDVRMYDRILSLEEIKGIYHHGLAGGFANADNNCADAGSITGATAEGIMLYNAGNNVLQYCNGEYWVGVGK